MKCKIGMNLGKKKKIWFEYGIIFNLEKKIIIKKRTIKTKLIFL